MQIEYNNCGLVLSGGGARGIAHIGVIKAMEEFNIHASHVSGTSMGAIVGSFYAAGLSTGAMVDFFKKVNLFSYKNYARKMPGFINPLVFHKYLEHCFEIDNFSCLKSKLYLATTNLLTGKGEIITQGQLIKAIMASAAFPGIFAPVEFNNQLYTDGGITNNYPIGILKPKCDFIIGSYVSPLKTVTKKELKTTMSVVNRVFHVLMYNLEEPYFNDANIFIMPEGLSNVQLFNLKQVDAIMEAGYIAATTSIKKYIQQKQISKSN
ncbi:MAG: patatin-like phospholipase family protein [Chitinophagaceae bacterium]|jgi:NTE family protein|nr:patatin-like phospholipase family protein [Chitinophagaceae bacterium]MBP6046494.1 patatin-like phospholipase family protein [Ferruginibacter sp.]NMD28969.1 patatin-like phospholipase family protein [Bacteroidota bacterium]MBK7089247.1 patatin-like phospholipase family protein [Chitinophagaceae bacterium]MBK7347581.1 patatin-like phospholipase family protein [Chitinophagaceae bacterium]